MAKTSKCSKEIIASKPVLQPDPFPASDMRKSQPRLLLVAPVLSGHPCDALLRGTVEALLPYLDVYITDWLDARNVPMIHGNFHLQDYSRLHHRELTRASFGPDIAFNGRLPAFGSGHDRSKRYERNERQSRAALDDSSAARSTTPRQSDQGQQNWLRKTHPLVRRNPRDYPRAVQLSGIHAPRLSRFPAAFRLYAAQPRPPYHRPCRFIQAPRRRRWRQRQSRTQKFYDEYLSVCDLPAEFYLESIVQVFQKHLLPKERNSSIRAKK